MLLHDFRACFPNTQYLGFQPTTDLRTHERCHFLFTLTPQPANTVSRS